MKKDIIITNDYLLIPVQKEAETEKVSFYCEKEKIYEFEIPLGEDEGAYVFHYYAAIPVREWKSRRITVEGGVTESFLKAIALSDDIPRKVDGKPLLHFSPDTGWMNDPNGLMFHEGCYHMFFQHNLFDTRWQNMSWGHAVSKDLLHWEQQEDVLFPDEDGTMFSGCGIVNEQGKLGLPVDAELLFFTCAGNTSAWSRGKKFVQKIAYSTDHGKTFHKKEGCVLGHIAGDNRDPKVYWYAEKGIYYMVLYLEKYEYGIFNSGDLEHWEMTQQLVLPQTWECPDLREIPIEGGGSKWMFWGADGHYFLGDFDGSRFETDGLMHKAYQTMLPYAAQSFWGKRRVIMIPWMRTNNKSKVYRSLMGIPRQLTLARKEDGFILRQRLADEFERCKEKRLECIIGRDAAAWEGEPAEKACPVEAVFYEQQIEAALEIKLFLEKDVGFSVNIYGTVCKKERGSSLIKIEGIEKRGDSVKSAARSYDKESIATEKLSMGKVCLKEGSWEEEGIRGLEAGKDLESISFLSDGEILEVTVEDGLTWGAYETKSDARNGEVRIEADGTIRAEIFQIL